MQQHKQLDDGHQGHQWQSSLLTDLAFIRKHLRYPLSKKTLPSLLVLSALLFLVFRLGFITVLLSKAHNALVFWFLIGLVGVTVAVTTYRYWAMLRFSVIATPFFVAENSKLLEAFLMAQQLRLYRHPDAPEVYQIMSRPLGNTRNEQREVMIFIVDDKRILINSHITGQRFAISGPSGNSRKMAHQLADWLASRQNGGSSVVVH
jgi:hypothetical protein